MFSYILRDRIKLTNKLNPDPKHCLSMPMFFRDTAWLLSYSSTFFPPQVMKDLLIHFQDRDMMENIEACIVHMDITSLDIQQVNSVLFFLTDYLVPCVLDCSLLIASSLCVYPSLNLLLYLVKCACDNGYAFRIFSGYLVITSEPLSRRVCSLSFLLSYFHT